MENSTPKYNTMGSEIEEGFICKPKIKDPNKAIMHYKTILMICDDERCGKAGKKETATKLRNLIKELGLSKGEKRIKISRSHCFGACRFRQVCNISENTQINGNVENNGLWLKNVHRYTLEDWRKLFNMLSANRNLMQELDSDSFIPMKIYD